MKTWQDALKECDKELDFFRKNLAKITEEQQALMLLYAAVTSIHSAINKIEMSHLENSYIDTDKKALNAIYGIGGLHHTGGIINEGPKQM